MPRSVLSQLAASGRTGVLVVGTALATAAVVGGGAVAVQTVADQKPAATPAPAAEISQGAEKRGLAKLAKLQRESQRGAQAPAAPFVCDPTKTHGQNISAYVHSLPKGPGRGALVSQAAKSDCGKSADGTPESAEDAESKAAKPAKPARPEGVGKPEKPADPTKPPGPDSPKESVGPQGSELPKSAPPESTPPESTPPESTPPESTPPGSASPGSAPPGSTTRP